MFDVTDPAHLALLKSEVETDPLGMGYNPGNHPSVLKLINTGDENLGGETSGRPFDAASMLDALAVADLDRASTNSGAVAYIAMLANLSQFFDISPYREKFRSLFGGGNTTVAALDAQSRRLSRGEVLFGEGTNIARDDWFAARDS